jgi:hypothetical protein
VMMAWAADSSFGRANNSLCMPLPYGIDDNRTFILLYHIVCLESDVREEKCASVN